MSFVLDYLNHAPGAFFVFFVPFVVHCCASSRSGDTIPRRWVLVQAMLGVGLVCAFAERVAADGPLVVTPYIAMSEQYNDNIYFTSNHTGDFVTSITPGLGLQYQQPRLVLSLSGGTSALIYAQQTSQNNIAGAQSGALSATYQASERLSLSVSDSVSRVSQTRTGAQPNGPVTTPPPAEQPSPDIGVSTLLPRGDALTNSFTGGAGYQLAPRWTGSAHYSNSVSTFTNPGGQNVTHQILGGLTYGWSPTLSLNGFFSYQRLILSQATDTETYSPTAGFSYAYDPTVSLSASAGAYINRPLQISVGNNKSASIGPTFNLTAAKAFEHGALTLTASQGITTSAGVAGVSQTRSVSLGYSTTLAQYLNGSIATSYSNFDTGLTSFQVFQLYTSLSYPVWQYINAGLSYSYRLSNSDQTVPGRISAGTVDGNIVQLYISASYPVWQGSL